MRVLVTGASGFLGRAVASLLVTEGHEVTTLQRRESRVTGVRDVRGSVTDADAVRRALGSAPRATDAVVHLAAKVSLAGEAAEFRAVNVDGTRLLLDASERAGVSRFVHISSPSVAHLGSSLVGASATVASPTDARGEYARTKAEAELLALGRDSEAMRVVAIRPHAVWGPGDAQLTERIIDRARRNRLPLLSGGRALIDSTYVDNAASAISAALARADAVHGKALVVTNGEPRPVADLLAGITRAAGVAPPRFSVPAALGRAAGSVVERVWALCPGRDEPPMTRFLAEQLSTAHWFDQRETRELLQWTPSVSLDEGFARLAEYYGR